MSLGAMLLLNQLFPPPKPPAKAPAAAAPANGKGQVNGKEPANGKEPVKAEAPAEGAAANNEKPKAEEAPKAAAAQPAAAALPAMAEVEKPTQYISLGSLDLGSDYRMLVTLTNAGAAVYRAEMADPRFLDQHDWSGWLGELELKNVPGGVLVQVVGAGTPAAKATANGKPAPIEAGDVIVGIGNPQKVDLKTAVALQHALGATDPGQEFVLQVRHGDNPPQPRTVRLVRRPLAVLRPESENYSNARCAAPGRISSIVRRFW